MNFGLTPSFAATALPISTSKPSTSPLCGFLTPNGGTSNLTPIVISPFSWILPSVVSAGNFSTVAAGVAWRRPRRSAAPLLVVAAAARDRQHARTERDAQPARYLHYPIPP